MGTKEKPGTYDCYGALKPNEPYFLLRGRDPLSAVLVRMWCTLRRLTRQPWNEREENKVNEALRCSVDMDQWRRDHDPEQSRTPVQR